MRRGRGQPGFTMLELLLAMLMVSLLAGSLYASLRIAFRARDSAISAITPVRAVHVAMDMLRTDLESALPPSGEIAGLFMGDRDEDGKDYVQFYAPGGTPDEMEPTRGGVRKIELAVMPSEDGASQVLVRRITENLLAQVAEEPEEQVLCRDVQSFTLRYYDGSSWLDSWDSSMQDNTLPVAVEVTLEIGWPPRKDPPDDTCTARRILTFACTTTAGGLP